jgi:uncharacterized protein (TIGR03435 family)
MKTYKRKLREFMDRRFSRVRQLPPEQVEFAGQRVLRRLRLEPEWHAAAPSASSGVSTAWMFSRPAIVAAAAAIVVAGFVSVGIVRDMMDRRSVNAVVELVDSPLVRVSGEKTYPLYAGARIEAGDTVRSDDKGGTFMLADESQVELQSRSEFFLEPADDGIRIRLNKGGILVNAAKQRDGHLYVQTKDMSVSVVGTVFFVVAEEEGSRVSVIEGAVQVRQGNRVQKLLPGEQISTSSKLKLLPIPEEIGWSRNAVVHLALLQQSTAVRLAAPSQDPASRKDIFEVAAVRASIPPPPGSGVRGGGPGGCGQGIPPEIDPKRFAAANKQLYWLASTAYFGHLGSCLNVSLLDLLSGGPEWVKSEQFDVEATMPDGAFTSTPTVSDPKLQRMLQNLLTDRFKLVVRRELKEMPVYVMTFTRAASQFAGANDVTHWLTRKPEGADWSQMEDRQGFVAQEKGRTRENPAWQGFFYGANATLSDIAPLIGRLTGRPIVNRTTVTAKFHYSMQYSVDAPPNNSPIMGPLNPGERDSLILELEKQMGIKLESSRAPVEVLVIEHAEKPSDN